MPRIWIAHVVGLLAAAFGVAMAYGFGALTGDPVSTGFVTRVAVTCLALAGLVLWVLASKAKGRG